MMMTGGSRSGSANTNTTQKNNRFRMLKLTASILSISSFAIIVIFWNSNSNDDGSTTNTLQRQLSSLQQFMDPKSTNLRSEIVGGGGGGVMMNQQTTNTINNQHGDPKCHPHDGIPITRDADHAFIMNYNNQIQSLKSDFDNHVMPDLMRVENSFYFRTLHPMHMTGRNWPALSRSWNDTFLVVDNDEFLPDGPKWGTVDMVNDARAMWSVVSPDDYSTTLIPDLLSQGTITKPAVDDSPMLFHGITSDTTTTSNNVRILPPGEYATFSGWFVGNFGHYLHDHVSKIAWLKSQVSSTTTFLLPYHKLHYEIMNVVDEAFVKERVLWIEYDETVHVPENGSLTVMIPHKNKPFTAYPETGTIFTEHLRQWLEETHWTSMKEGRRDTNNNKKVIFYTRTGGTTRRIVEPSHEEEILSLIRSKMVQYGRNEEDLIIYSGTDGNGNTLSIKEQFDIFSQADTAIGPHGSGLANIIWMDGRCDSGTKVLEFASSERTRNIQSGSHWGYYLLYGTMPWIDYNYMYYLEGSEENAMYIDLAVLEQTLDAMWGEEGSVA